MIVYCAISIRGEKTFQDFFPQIVEHITSLGHTALSELNVDFKPVAPLTDSEIFTRDVKWIDKSKVLIAEISGASTGIGFEIAYALYKKKIPVLALANKEAGSNVSAMINGCQSQLITIKRYEDSEDLKKAISDFLKKNNE
ncbi:MAG: nucleoside 2-deoxyribosyltransferase [Ignavibacteria bacterium]|nr:nucleoside 2-deoxyribosyltransferase [Ignavibacteria bacterium]